MAQFTGASAPTVVERRELARLFADGVLEARAEIWQGGLHRRDVDVTKD